jgi:CheY-like chemotaxis protein
MKKILIIEDEILIQRSLKMLLERRGHFVMTTPSGREAISLIKSHKFDKIICDLMLQDISGFDVIEESKLTLGPLVIKDKFIIITAYSSSHVLEKASSYNCLVINKPFDNLEKTLDLFTDEKK